MPPAIELTHLSKTYAKRGSPPLQAVADLNVPSASSSLAMLNGWQNGGGCWGSISDWVIGNSLLRNH